MIWGARKQELSPGSSSSAVRKRLEKREEETVVWATQAGQQLGTGIRTPESVPAWCSGYSHRCQSSFFHALQDASVGLCSALCYPREGELFPGEQGERQEEDQSSVEKREAEKARKNREPDRNPAPPMGSAAAQCQVTASKLVPAWLGWREGERAEGSLGLRRCPWRLGCGYCPPSPSRTGCPPEPLQNILSRKSLIQMQPPNFRMLGERWGLPVGF